MSLIGKGYNTYRWNDFGGGINVRDSSDAINDKEWTMGVNMVTEGNKLALIKGYTNLFTLASGITPGQGITLYQDSVIALHGSNLYIYNINSGSLFTEALAVDTDDDKYQILTTKSFSSGKISIVLINTNPATTEDVKAYEFDGAVFTTMSFTSLSNKNFKCGTFFQGKLWLGGNPTFPSSLYTSRTGSVINSGYIYDFSAYDSTSQNIGDGEPIVGIITNGSELFVFKTNSFHKLISSNDTGSAVAYVFRQESSSGALNPHCILAVEQDIIFFDGDNFRRVSYEANLAALSDDSISKEITKIIDGLPDTQSLNATMYYIYPHVKLCLRDKFSLNNSINILYNIVDKSFTTQTGLSVSQGVGGFINSKRVAYFLTPFSSTIYQDEVSTTYDGGNINFYQKSKRYVFGDGVDYKRVSQVELHGNISPGLTVYFDLVVGGQIVDTRSINFEELFLSTTGSANVGNTLLGSNSEDETDGIRDYVVRYPLFHDGRDFQLITRGNGIGSFELHGMNVMCKPIRAYDIH